MEIINKELVAIFGLVIAIAILGGAFVHVLWQFTFQFQDNEVLENKLESLETEKKTLTDKIQKLESDLENLQKSKIIVNEGANISIDQGMNRDTMNPEPVTIAEGSYSGMLTEKNLIIKSNDDLQKLWNELEINVQMPSVNFKQSMIIGVFYGEKPNLCYSVYIDSIKPFAGKEKDVNTVVYVTKTIPADDSICPKRTTQSYHIIQTPFKTDNVFFSENIVEK